LRVDEHIDYYLDQGFCVIPAFPRSKRPAVQWLVYQSRRPSVSEIDGWRPLWARGYNIGVICGRVSDGLICIDIDSEAYLRRFDIERLKRDTMVVVTGSGKYHIYVRSLGVVRTTRLMHGGRVAVEIRGEGSFTILPNSIHPETGMPYKLLSKPDEILTVEDPVGGVKRVTGLDERVETSRVKAELLGFEPPCIRRLLGSKIPEGFRNEAICRLTSYMMQRGVGYGDALVKALAWNAEHCDPPLDEREVESVVRSIYKHGYTYGCRSMSIFRCSKRCRVYKARKMWAEALATLTDRIKTAEEFGEFWEFRDFGE